MADEIVPSPTPDQDRHRPGPFGGSNTFGFLTAKWGPAPAFVWLGGVFAVFYIGNKIRQRLTGDGGAAGDQIDPASGTAYKDEVYDVASGASYAAEYQTLNQKLQQQTGTQPAGSNGTRYNSNDEWRTAALNYLTSLGYSGTVATKALDDYLRGQVPTPAEQTMIDAAIKYLGGPPDQPAPAGGGAPLPPSSGGTGGGTPAATKPPGGVKITSHSATKNTVTVHWSKASGTVKGYHVSWSSKYTKKHFVDELGASTLSWTSHPGLHPGIEYTVFVRAYNTKGEGPESSVKVTTPRK